MATRDPRISDIFYYFESHTTIASGRTVGRKIGVVQEILCKKLLLTSGKVRDCVIYEPKIPGRSGATHKVEFVLLQPVFVADASVGSAFSVTPDLSVSVLSTDPAKERARIIVTAKDAAKITVKAGVDLKVRDYIPASTLLVKVVSVGASRVRLAVLDFSVPVASIESKRVGAQRFSGSDKLGSGIQTIEKAKQASLVAADFDLNFNQTLLALSGAKGQRSFRSFVVLGNGVHWTDQDLKILETYVDYTYLASDAAVIRYADFVARLAAQSKADFFKFFMKYFKGMTKTPPDAFSVSEKDFVAMRPKNAGSLLRAVEQQIQPYPVKVI